MTAINKAEMENSH